MEFQDIYTESESRNVWVCHIPLQQMKVVCVDVEVILSQSTSLKLVLTEALGEKNINILLSNLDSGCDSAAWGHIS